MSFISHFPLFSSIVRKLSEKFTSKENNKSKIAHIETTVRLSETRRPDIDNYYCKIEYRPETYPSASFQFFDGKYNTKEEMDEIIEYFDNIFTITKLTTGVVFK